MLSDIDVIGYENALCKSDGFAAITRNASWNELQQAYLMWSNAKMGFSICLSAQTTDMMSSVVDTSFK